MISRPQLAIGVIGAAIVVLWWGIGSDTDHTSYEYLTEPVSRGAIRASITATGRVVAVNSVDVGTQLSGQLAEVLADFNDSVSAGDPIARLDDRTFKARVMEAEARLQSARAEVAAAKAAIDGAKARFDEAQRIFDRQDPLFRKDQISSNEMDRARAELATAKSALAVAEAELLGREASVSIADAALNQARVDLERSVIRSPIDGIVIARKVEAGQTVAASLEAPVLFTIAEGLDRMQVQARIDEADIGQVAAGQQAVFQVDAYPQREFTGTVEDIHKAPETVSNVVTYTAIVDTENPGGELLPGMTALLDIVVAGRSDVTRVPNAALRYRPPGDPPLPAAAERMGNAVVWRLAADGEPEPVSVTTGVSDDSHTELLNADLAPGSAVIVGHLLKADDESSLGLQLGF